jgi:aspartyl-tRNA(Asn)/glutamyl-tRNA(Gln) amidotransferase subunit B
MTQYLIEGKKNQYEITIGCEIHAQIATNSKLFSRSATKFGSPQNSQTSFIDAAMPGMLPTINKEAVCLAIKTGLGINAKINKRSIFDRKNYFYADLPQGYQISQYLDPIVSGGYVDINLENGDKKTIKIERIHLEQDAGKSIHDQDPKLSFIDLNRSGVPLMEIVSEPDMSSPFEAAEYVKKIRSIVRSLGSSDGDMEKGNLRCDANVSVKIKGDDKLGTRCEIKNLNSTKNIMAAIEFEANRQVEIIENGGEIDQETRLFDVLTGETKTMRSKEDAMDYRYFPDPDLPPLVVSDEMIENIKRQMPELPDAKKERYINDFGVSDYDATILTSDTAISEFFEEVIKENDAKTAITWINVELLGRVNKLNIKFSDLKFGAKSLADLLLLIKNKVISGKIAKDVLDIMIENGDDAKKIVEEKGLKQVTDIGEIKQQISKILEKNPDKVEQYKAGKDKLFGFFVGQVMKETKGKANPQIVNQILKELLS